MARGWESKDVESQQELAEERRRLAAVASKAESVIAREKEIESLELSRRRVQHDLDTAQNARYRVQLEAALAHLDSKLASLR